MSHSAHSIKRRFTSPSPKSEHDSPPREASPSLELGSPPKRLRLEDGLDEKTMQLMSRLGDQDPSGYTSLAGREFGPLYNDWPAPATAILTAQRFILEIIQDQLDVLIVPDKDADGLSAGTLLHTTLLKLGLPWRKIKVQHLHKGTNVHSGTELQRMRACDVSRVIVLDQGSRPGEALFPPDADGAPRTLIIDHHMSSQWPEHSQVLTACHSPPIVTTSLLTYILLRDLASDFVRTQSWRALVGFIGDLGPNAAQWGEAPWPSELGQDTKAIGSKALSDAVAAINAPRRTAEYNVPRAWEIFLQADGPKQVASHAYLKVCKLDVSDETTRWARTPPKFSEDGRIALITIATGFQIHPVIATRWAGTLGRKSSKLIMVMCANTDYNPDKRVSFSCRIAASLRKLPDDKRPNLIQMLMDIGKEIPGFLERVGGDYARGHKEATGGIIPKEEFATLIDHLGIGKPKPAKQKSPAKPRTGEKSIRSFFEVIPK